MDDLKIVRDFCAEETPPRGGELAGLRARVLASFGGAQPVSRALPRGRAQWRPRLPRPRLALAGGAVAAVTAGAVAAAVLVPSGIGTVPVGPAHLDAALVLTRAAQAAAAAPQPGSSEFVYSNTVFRYGVKATGPYRLRGIESWLSVTGRRTGIVRTVPCLPMPNGVSCSAKMVPKVNPGLFTYAGLEKLPTRPEALLGYLDAEQSYACGPHAPPGGTTVSGLGHVSRTAWEWSGVLTILQDEPLLPPRFGSALLRAAAQLPGATLVQHARSATGVAGVGVARTVTVPGRGHTTTREREEVIFSSRTYRYLGDDFYPPTAPRQGVATAVAAARFTRTAPPATASMLDQAMLACNVL